MLIKIYIYINYRNILSLYIYILKYILCIIYIYILYIFTFYTSLYLLFFSSTNLINKEREHVLIANATIMGAKNYIGKITFLTTIKTPVSKGKRTSYISSLDLQPITKFFLKTYQNCIKPRQHILYYFN